MAADAACGWCARSRRLPGELAAARAEAAKAFGSDEVFCERYLPAGRHVEVQLLADAHGTVWAVGDRDCSLQRRHQKVIEEAPAPGLPEAVRAGLHAAAVSAARAIGYTGAGTAEFMLGEDGRFHFLEMNTRLQVEHPVTEAVTGLDLVALQLAVAEGERLPGPVPPPATGCAIEARLYAEDPAKDWQPATGTLHRLELTVPHQEFGGRGVRLDSGVAAGDEITPHYDAMLAKVIAWAPTRAAAARRLADALARAEVHGPATNRELLVRALRHPAFLAARLHTGFLAEHAAELTAPDGRETARAALAAALADAAARRTGPHGALPSGWRNLPSQSQSKRYRTDDGAELEVRYRLTRDGLRADDHPRTEPWTPRPSRSRCARAPSGAATASRATATGCTSTPRTAASRSPPCRASPTPPPGRTRARCSPRCPAPSCAPPPPSATPSPPVSRCSSWRR